MKLRSIQLHPFGGFAERTCELHDGLNVLAGPNEYGKSTLNNALWHALFTPTNLTKVKLEKIMGRWYPKPAGDHVRVTVRFEADGKRWTLSKGWGAGRSSSLQAEGEAALADPDGVQNRLAELLTRNQATWQHVLFLDQAQLNRTMDALKEHSGSMDRVEPLLAGAAAIPGDVPAQELQTALQERIDAQFSNWDRVQGRPEQGRGIDNRWQRRVGPVLEAYYKKEEVRRKLNEVVAYEKQVDELHDKIREAKAAVLQDHAFVENGQKLRGGLNQRRVLGGQIQLLRTEQTTLQGVQTEWPVAIAAVPSKNEQIGQLSLAIGKLDKEMAHARKRESAGERRAQYEALAGAREKWKDAKEAVKGSHAIAPETLQKLRNGKREMERLRIELEARKLSAKLTSASPADITITKGLGEPEAVSLEPGAVWEEQVDGKLRVEWNGVVLDVSSGTGEVQTLVEELEAASGRQQALLRELQAASLEEAEKADADHRALVETEKQAKAVYDAKLLGKTEEEWAALIAELDALPQTRSVSVLEEEKQSKSDQRAALGESLSQEERRIAEWTQKYESHEKLLDLALSKRADLSELEREMQGLPVCPEGFESIEAYLNELHTRETDYNEAKERLEPLKNDLAGLTAPHSGETAEDLREALEAKQRVFDREMAKGESLLRIAKTLRQVVERRGNVDPLAELKRAVSRNFQALTNGRYARVRMEGTRPVGVARGGAGGESADAAGDAGNDPASLGVGVLSQGTEGSLALATRLALAELYLDGMEGFLVLDDAFTDMDPDRRQAAVKSLGEFASSRQVLFFTCHPEHAQDLSNLAGGQAPRIEG